MNRPVVDKFRVSHILAPLLTHEGECKNCLYNNAIVDGVLQACPTTCSNKLLCESLHATINYTIVTSVCVL